MDIRKAPTKVDDSSGFRFLGVDDDTLISITPDDLMKTTPEYSKIRNNGTSISPNADFAEVAEWFDGNTSNENRIGYFVSVSKTESGITMVKATSTSDVRGVTIDQPAFAANASNDKYDENKNLLKQYNYVAFAGFATVIDNGTCTVNDRCISDDNGCAIPSDNTMGYQVIDRIDSNKVLILVEPNADMLNRIKNDITEINDDIDKEIERAKSAEKSNADAITAETTRAKNVESDITDALDSEIERAKNAENTKAPLASPTFTGTPKAPTASAGTSTTQIATTAFTQTAVSNHNTSTTAHTDIRELISDLTTRLNALADSDDTTLDQLSEIVAYIKDNRTLIESITTNKVNVVDIVDNLTSTTTNKPLSANQGKVLNDLISALTSIVDTKVDDVSGDSHIDASVSGTTATITHKDVSRSNTTSTASPSSGSTFTAVDSVTSDSKGHITGVNTKTITLPNTSVVVDSELDSSSTNPVQNKVVYNTIEKISKDIYTMSPTEFSESITYKQDSSTQIEDTGSSIEYLVYEKVIESAENLKDIIISADSVTYAIEAGASSGDYITISLNLYVNEYDYEFLVYQHKTAGENVEITEDGFEFSANYLDYSSLTFPCTIQIKAFESYSTYQVGTVTSRTSIAANPENMMLKYTADAPKTHANMADEATKAEQDGNGNVIANTYLPKANVVNNLTTSSSSAGYALNAYQGYLLNNRINTLERNSIRDIIVGMEGIKLISPTYNATISITQDKSSFIIVRNCYENGYPYRIKLYGEIKFKYVGSSTYYIDSSNYHFFLPFTCGISGGNDWGGYPFMSCYTYSAKIIGAGISDTGITMDMSLVTTYDEDSNMLRYYSNGTMYYLWGYALKSKSSSLPLTPGETYTIELNMVPMMWSRDYIKYA